MSRIVSNQRGLNLPLCLERSEKRRTQAMLEQSRKFRGTEPRKGQSWGSWRGQWRQGGALCGKWRARNQLSPQVISGSCSKCSRGRWCTPFHPSYNNKYNFESFILWHWQCPCFPCNSNFYLTLPLYSVPSKEVKHAFNLDGEPCLQPIIFRDNPFFRAYSLY